MEEGGACTIGLLGFGALAAELVGSFDADAVEWVALVRDAGAKPVTSGVRFVDNLPDLVAAAPAAVVEVAGHGAVGAHVPDLLEAGIPVILASAGALSDEALSARITQARAQTGTRLVIPSGAVGGLDYIAAISRLPDAAIRYTSRKPVAAWTAELAARGLDSGSEVVLFEGSPAEAARLYPKNLNAAFTIAQAAWPAPLSVRVVADPQAAGNTHEIEATSAAGTAFLRFVNAPSRANPKSSMVTALSLAAALRGLLQQERRG